MVGWQGHARWAHIDIFNLLGINPHTTDLAWEIVDARPRQIVKKLRPNDSSITPPEGVSIPLINAFRSELFSILYPSVQRGEELHAGDATPDSQEELAKVLNKINSAKLNGYCRIRDAENGVPGDWLGEDISSGDGLAGSSAAHSLRHSTNKYTSR
ncbi:hypothetical protein K458DRAFT_409314 [Lentithecium fluviatile CBS 122367]|uniref:Uncharacterized protein n=1 Tax=Lentithecium fluviatile CBS 122367 TaxID=1168545 RepID=A0A6G1IIN3_9PLEO|nr:hypothetical protein K458DRAFT_409314 [Lentithecium fluviatile CBS 122367]